MFKYLINKFREYIFIILTATILLFISSLKSFSEENIFVIDNVEVNGTIDLNFSRDKYVNQAFLKSFDMLTSRILLSRDLNKISNIKLKKIKNLIRNFQIIQESYKSDEYNVIFKIFYNDFKVKKLLVQKNISFSQPKNVSAVFFPVLIIDDEIKNFEENYFYNQWLNIKIENETINFVLPLEYFDDVYKIKEMKNRIEDINFNSLVNKYDLKNYVFAIMDYSNHQLKAHIKTSFNENKMTKNILYEIKNIHDESELSFISRDLKMQITELWKEANIVNLLMPLSITIQFQYDNLISLDKLKNNLRKISIVDNYFLEEFDINHSYFKIYYYGNPKKLATALLKFGYQLRNEQGHWKLSLYD